MRQEVEQSRVSGSVLADIVAPVDGALRELEARTIQAEGGMLAAIALALQVTAQLYIRRFRIRRLVRARLEELAISSRVIDENRKRVLDNTFNYLDRRLSVLRKFAQLRACERLFSLWHVIHYPLFMVLVVAAFVHVISVNMY